MCRMLGEVLGFWPEQVCAVRVAALDGGIKESCEASAGVIPCRSEREEEQVKVIRVFVTERRRLIMI